MRATSASRLDTCAVKAPRSAAAKVGSSFAKTSPALTCWPSRTSIERTIAVSNGCTKIVGAFETAMPCTITTWSTGISPIVVIITITRLVMTHTVPRAERGIGALMIAVDGHWNSRIAGKVGSVAPRRRTTSALDEDLLMSYSAFLIAADEARRDGAARAAAIHVAVLLRPQLAVEVAALQQDLVRRDVDQLALLQNEDLVAFGQRRQAVRDDDHRPPLGDAQQVGADHRLALRVEGARRLVEDQDPRVVDQGPGDRDPLLLPARQIRRALLDIGLVAVRHA